MKVKEIQNRLERGYVNSIYGTSANTHEQMTNDIKTLLEVICNTRCCYKLPCKDDKTSEILQKLKECATKITELNTIDEVLEFEINRQKLTGVLKDR